jgi:hypothetical protein
MESNSFDGAGFAVPVMEQLRPAIEAFLAP